MNSRLSFLSPPGVKVCAQLEDIDFEAACALDGVRVSCNIETYSCTVSICGELVPRLFCDIIGSYVVSGFSTIYVGRTDICA